MNTYVISGAEKTTGADMRIELDAADETEARQAALQEGILITECKQINQNAPRAANRTEAYLREIALWLRFFGITAAVSAFVIILKLIMSR